MTLRRIVLVPLVAALAACQPKPPPAVDNAAKAQEQAREADAMASEFDKHFEQERWSLARAQGDILLAEYPQSAAAKRIAERHAQARAKADEESERSRLMGLWSYQSQDVKGGKQLSATLFSKESIDTGAGKSRVRLIFRDHPEWKRSSYLVLDSGDFDCYGGCSLKLDVDGKARSLPGSRPKTDEAIAMFIEDERGMWRLAKGARQVVIDVPVKGRGRQKATFETGGLDPMRMPGW